MSKRTFAVGDIQGCLDPLQRLLDHVKFDPSKDQLWCVGDLVNRGPNSLGALSFLYDMRKSLKVVLGNHDLHLLAMASGHSPKKDKDLMKIIESENADKLLKWLSKRPLFHRDKDKKLAMCHAGIPPMWDVKKAEALSEEVEAVLQSPKADKFYKHMYGNEPHIWEDSLTGMERIRCIVNYFTRMRFIGPHGELDLNEKGNVIKQDNDLQPWFHYQIANKKYQLLFGHWAALGGVFDHPNVIGLDTGCVWGGPMTLMHIESGQRYLCALDDKKVTHV